ncbi:MAG: hypothetical protein FWG62_00230 [Proteobacteria bacterium]|nr:hypothetical protein [Pseudomonadota bacterium]
MMIDPDNQPVRKSPLPIHGTRLRRVPLVLLLVFLFLLLVGIAVDEPTRVLEQARSVCLSCIGIG